MTRPSRIMRMNTIIALLEDAREEMLELERYEQEENNIYRIEDKDEKRAAWHEYYEHWAGHEPKRQHINDNLKVARRLILGLYMK